MREEKRKGEKGCLYPASQQVLHNTFFFISLARKISSKESGKCLIPKGNNPSKSQGSVMKEERVDSGVSR